ncbi:methyl-accepting chemotaxis protein [Bdellovibrionota bacterium FG-1]
MLKKLSAKLERFPLKTKLFVSTGLFLFTTLTIGVVSQLVIRSLTISVYSLSSSSASADWLTQASITKPELLQYLWTAAFDYDFGKKTPDAAIKDILTTSRNFEEAIKKYSVEAPLSPNEKVLYEKLEKAWSPIQARVKVLTQILKEATVTRAEISKQVSSLTDDCLALSDALSELGALVKQKGTVAADQSAALERKNTLFAITITIFGLAVAAISFGLVSSISKWLGELAKRLVCEAGEIASASTAIGESANKLSAGTTQQGAAVQETVAALEEVSSTLERNAENTTRSSERSGTCSEAAGRGKQAVEKVIGSMDEINRSNAEIIEQVEAGNREISEIVKVIAEIGNKTKIINDIVFQTKLLSFNASVEAARAGEHGKGFAVVAEEIGNLAQMSGNSAKEISEMLETSIRNVESIITKSRTRVEQLIVGGRQKVEAGIQTAKDCGTVLDNIVVNVDEVNQMITQIATATHEQSQGVSQIKQAMNQIEQATNQNSDVSHQSAAMAKQLTSQSESLNVIVSDLEKMVHGTERPQV